MSDVSLSTFPTGKISALTMLYLQNQDLRDKSPEELLDLYNETYQRINKHAESKRKEQTSGWF